MAKKHPTNDGDRKAALLCDCRAGRAGEVVSLPSAEVDALIANGEADDNPAAIAARDKAS